MDGKSIAYFIVLLVIVGISYGVYHTTEIDEASKELTSLTEQVAGLQERLNSQASHLELRREVAALLSATTILQAEANSLSTEVSALRDESVKTRASFEQAIIQSRQNAAGFELGEVEMPNGLRLHNARVQKVEGETTTIFHSGGISKFSPDMLPRELQDRFRFGFLSGESTPRLNKGTEAPKPDPAAKDSAEAGIQKKTDIRQAQLQLEKLQKELPYLREELARAETESSGSTSPTRRYYAKTRRDAVDQQITALKRQIDAASLRVSALKSLP